jgi:hypothetical protein
MAENVLKKEFKEKDVQRLRNLMQGKYGEKATVGTGYTKQYEHHEEGDIWEEDDRTWTIKNGVKQNITKLDTAKKEINLPLFCPCCSKIMKPHLDKRFYLQYKRCFNCQVDFEHSLRQKGLLEEYEKFINNSDIDGMINEFNIWIDEELNTKNESYITEAGDVERWSGNAKQKLLESKEETIKYLESLKK